MILELVVSIGLVISQIPLPPAKYDRPHANLIITYETPANVYQLCKSRNHNIKGHILACAYIGRNPCIMIMPHRQFYPKKIWERIFRHEQGHCNGWKGHHPDARY